MLVARELSIGYADQIVLKNFGYEFPAHIHFLIGANGAGKSTLLRTLAGVQKELKGHVFYKTHELNELSAQNQRPAFLPADTEAHPYLRVKDLLDIYSSADSRWRSQKILDLLQIEDFLSLRLEELSSGERKRAFLASVLSHPSDFVILDEPFNFLDWQYSLVFHDLMTEQCKHGRGFLLALHDLQWTLRANDSDTLVLSEGKILYHGPSLNAFENKTVQDSFGVIAKVVDNPIDGSRMLALASNRKSKHEK